MTRTAAGLTDVPLGHSPDADDVFMWWPLTEGLLDTAPYRFVPVAQDIQALNERAVERADLPITAMSLHAYPFAAAKYALTAFGASFGEGYGPVVVAREGRDADWLAGPGVVVATPGEKTTAHLTLQLLLGRPFACRAMPFDRVLEAVARGEVDAGLVIHEGQLTFEAMGLAKVVDLGAWWRERTGLPLPLGVNAVRLDLDEQLGKGATQRILALLRRSVETALDQRERSLQVAAKAAGRLPQPLLERFVAMYVNERTLEMGREGEEAIRALLAEAALRGLAPPVEQLRVLRG